MFARDRRELAGEDSVGARVLVHRRLREDDQVDGVSHLADEVEVALREEARVLLGLRQVSVLVVPLQDRDPQSAGRCDVGPERQHDWRDDDDGRDPRRGPQHRGA